MVNRGTIGLFSLSIAAILTLVIAANAEAGPNITASSVHSGSYAAPNAFDGNRKTRWASQPKGKPEWLQIDFGKEVPIEQLAIHWETAHPSDYEVQVSSDGKTWKTLHHNKACKGGKELLQGLGGKGRYLRIQCNRQTAPWNLSSIWEVELLDKQAIAAKAEANKQAVAAKAEAAKAAREAQVKAMGSVADRLAEHGVEEIIFALRQPGKDGHWYANFGYYSDSKVTNPQFSPYDKEGKKLLYGPGGKLCRLNVKTGEMKLLVDDPKGGVRDPVVHYDGRKILFSYRPSDTQFYNLYEINVDGSDLRQLTDAPFDDIEATYLPDGGIMFVSTRCKRWVQCWLTQVAVLYRCDGDGRNIRPISANLEQDNTPWVLHDGRILYQRWEYVDRSQVDYHHLWTTNPDGTGQMVYYGNMHPGVVMIDAKSIPNTKKVVAIFSPGHGRREHDGNVTIVDPSKGPDDRGSARAVSRHSCRDPWAFSEELFLVAQGQQIALMGADGNLTSIYQCTPEEKKAGLQCHEPRPLMCRKRERIIPDRTQPESNTGTVVIADVYKGRNMKGIKRGDIKKLLVIESLPKPINFTGGMDPLTYGGSFTLERIVGTVPVEEDGSASVEMPALRALFFVALDENDLSVKRMQSFLTIQPGEVTSCVGCHEQRTESFMPNRTLMAMKRPPSKIQPFEDCPDVFDFPRDIQPILNRLCVDCHGYEKTKRGGPYAGQISLTGDRGPMFSHAYFTMTVYKLFSDGRNIAKSNYPPRSLGSGASRILKMIDGSHYGAKATEHEKRMLRLWIEAGAPYPGTYAALGSGSLGGYAQNRLINTDNGWPTTKAGAEVIQKRCASCHSGGSKGRKGSPKGNNVLPRSMSDERGLSFWRFNINDPRLKLSRHIVFNLTRPEKSLMLLAPLSKKAGGLELCRKEDKPVAIFADTNDPDYQTLLEMVAAGKENLETITRFDMPHFRPRPEYLREMQRYGILPPDHDMNSKVDAYELDQAYWKSLWHRAMRSP